MTMQDIFGKLINLPAIPLGVSGVPNFNTTSAVQINASDEAAGMVFEAPKAGNITKIVFMIGNTVVTGSTLEVRLETVDLTTSPASPNGLVATGTNATQAITTGDTNTMFEITLTNPATVTRGQMLAVQVKQPNASPGDCRIASFGDAGGANATIFPYQIQNLGVSPTVTWTTAENLGSPILALGYSDGSYVVPQGCFAMSTITGVAYNNTSTPNTKGIRITTRMGLRVQGFWLWANLSNDGVCKLVNTNYHQANATGIIKSLTLDKDARGQTFGGVRKHFFDAEVKLDPGTYRLIVEPTSASNIQVYDYTLINSGIFNYLGGPDIHYTQAKDPTAEGSWTNFNSGSDGYRIGYMGLLVDGVDIPANIGSFTWAA